MGKEVRKGNVMDATECCTWVNLQHNAQLSALYLSQAGSQRTESQAKNDIMKCTTLHITSKI
jgi:hypothetical protein